MPTTEEAYKAAFAEYLKRIGCEPGMMTYELCLNPPLNRETAIAKGASLHLHGEASNDDPADVIDIEATITTEPRAMQCPGFEDSGPDWIVDVKVSDSRTARITFETIGPKGPDWVTNGLLWFT